MNLLSDQIRARRALQDWHEAALELDKPDVVDLVCLGNTCADYVRYQLRKEPGIPMANQTWVVNRGIRVFQNDLAWVMDDLEGEAAVDSEYGDYLQAHLNPIVTSRSYLGFPSSCEYPLHHVVRFVGKAHMYWHNSVPYIIAYACALGVKELRLWGADYTLPDGRVIEDDRANVEYWIGVARTYGMRVGVTHNATLLNTAKTQGKDWFYGYRDGVLPTGWDAGVEQLQTLDAEEGTNP